MSAEKIHINAEFAKSSADWNEKPGDGLPEIAFIGRSNVGKSSLINMLTGRKKLAKISSKPGKTRLINHFRINDSWYLVDLPGYGWARVSKKEQEKWEGMISGYLLNSQDLVMVFVLVDSRHEPQASDLRMVDWLGENGIPVGVIFTKSDKKGKTLVQKNVALFNRSMKQHWEELPIEFISSSQERTGREEILRFIMEQCLTK